MIAQRTKDALAAAKARGVTLGNPQLAEARDKANAASVAAADAFAANVRPIIEQIRASGVQSFRGTVTRLTAACDGTAPRVPPRRACDDGASRPAKEATTLV
jgi:hypothetical protein